MPRRKKIDPKSLLDVAESKKIITPEESPIEPAKDLHSLANGSTIIIVPIDHPRLNEWNPTPSEIKFAYIDEVVKASFTDILGEQFPKFETFKIAKKHFKERMTDVCHHINYYIRFYDKKQEYMMAMMSMKMIVDYNPKISVEDFKNLLLSRVVTDSFVENVKSMMRDLYTVNINTDREGKYRSTPKITNEQAKMIMAVSFGIRMILPLCVHFSNTNAHIQGVSAKYVAAFDSIFMALLQKFETPEVSVFTPLCRFVEYRLERFVKVDALIWSKKKQLYGITPEYIFQNTIHEVLLVKSLYKISYDRPVVSYIDGVVTNSYNHFRFENFKFKPIEIEADGGGSDNDDYLTHAESLEMTIYRIDESNMMINDANNAMVLKRIYERFQVGVTEDELSFYEQACHLNYLTQHLLHTFYSRTFHSSTAIQTIGRKDTIHLMAILKHYLQMRGMVWLPQLVTAVARGHFHENMIKNAKFIEKVTSSPIWEGTITKKYKYLDDISPKNNLIIQRLCTIINSSFIIIDPDPEINGRIIEDVPVDPIIDEYLTFIAIT